jgi:hypothetical protein
MVFCQVTKLFAEGKTTDVLYNLLKDHTPFHVSSTDASSMVFYFGHWLDIIEDLLMDF